MSACQSPQHHHNVFVTFMLCLSTGMLSGADGAPQGGAAIDVNSGLSVTIAGQQLIGDGQPWLQSVTFEREDRSDPAHHKQSYQVEELDRVAGKVDAAAGTITQTFAWGDVVYALRRTDLGAAIDITLHNAGEVTIADFDLRLCRFTLPATPTNWDKDKTRVYSSLDRVVSVSMDLPGMRLAVGPETIYPPLRTGCSKALDKERLTYDWHLRGAECMAADLNSLMPLGLARVPAGGELSVTVFIRWGAPEADLVDDLHQAFAEEYPYALDWKDRRPIGMLMFQSGKKSPTNPRGWFKDAKPPIDVTTDAGRTQFREETLKWADRSVDAMTKMGAQGGIVWNVEGEENPHPITYIGDPRMLGELAPEMDEIADELFQRFRDAGLRTGICIRPTQIYLKDGKWAHGTGSHGPDRNPLGEAYDQPEGLPWWHFFPVVERMSRKIAYAQKRWGCTLFYVDTNGMFMPMGTEGKFDWLLVTGRMWRELQARHPDCLIIPELMHDKRTWHTATYAYAAPYMELDLKGYGTPDWVRKPYPDAFSVVNIADGPIEDKRSVLVEAVRSGDILLSRGWFGDKRNAIVRGIYEEAGVSLEPPAP